MKLKNWYQFEYPITIDAEKYKYYSPEYTKSYRNALFDVTDFIQTHKLKKWWFLCYKDRLIVRIELSKSSTHLIGKMFRNIDGTDFHISEYFESDDKFKSELELLAFCDIMCIASKLTIARLNDSKICDVFRFSERTFHCIWNILHGPPMEIELYNSILGGGEDLMKINGDDLNKTIYDVT